MANGENMEQMVFNREVPVDKLKLRAELDSGVEKFLASGGAIKPVDGYNPKPRTENKNKKRQKHWRESYGSPRFFNFTANTQLREWSKARKNRALDLAKVMKISENYISMRVCGHTCLSVESLRAEFIPAMRQVESLENGQQK